MFFVLHELFLALWGRAEAYNTSKKVLPEQPTTKYKMNFPNLGHWFVMTSQQYYILNIVILLGSISFDTTSSWEFLIEPPKFDCKSPASLVRLVVC